MVKIDIYKTGEQITKYMYDKGVPHPAFELLADLLTHCETQDAEISRLRAALTKVQEDINWMTNTDTLLNRNVFQYIDNALNEETE